MISVVFNSNIAFFSSVVFLFVCLLNVLYPVLAMPPPAPLSVFHHLGFICAINLKTPYCAFIKCFFNCLNFACMGLCIVFCTACVSKGPYDNLVPGYFWLSSWLNSVCVVSGKLTVAVRGSYLQLLQHFEQWWTVGLVSPSEQYIYVEFSELMVQSHKHRWAIPRLIKIGTPFTEWCCFFFLPFVWFVCLCFCFYFYF